MKALLILITLTLVSCNGSGGGTTSSDTSTCVGTPSQGQPGNDACSDNKVSNAITYIGGPVYPTTNYYGTITERSKGAPIFKDSITLPQNITVTENSNSSLRVGDQMYIMLNNYWQNRCRYLYNGTKFVFDSCLDDIAGFQAGDQINGADYSHPSTLETNKVELVLFGRVSTDLHTGLIKAETTL